jgi:DNA polymerase
MDRMGGAELRARGITEDDMLEMVRKWRRASPKIVRLWYAMEDAALECVETRERRKVGPITFYMRMGILHMQLPSGRPLCYVRPELRKKPTKVTKSGYIQGGECMQLTYEGVDQVTKQWGRIDTYGGKLVENAVQGIARDLLAEKMLVLDGLGQEIVLHVHDEAVLEVSGGEFSLDLINKTMSSPCAWAPGLPLGADSFLTKHYKKD